MRPHSESATFRFDVDLVDTPDEVIEHEVADALAWDHTVPIDAVHARSDHGRVTLTGCVAWHFQRLAAEEIARHVAGVKDVINAIVVPPAPEPSGKQTAH